MVLTYGNELLPQEADYKGSTPFLTRVRLRVNIMRVGGQNHKVQTLNSFHQSTNAGLRICYGRGYFGITCRIIHIFVWQVNVLT